MLVSKLPGNFPAFLWATFKRLSPKEFTEATKLKHRGADRLLGSAVKKLTTNPDGTFSTSKDHTASELKLMQDLCCVLVSKPAFDNEKLFSDFSATLKSHSLLKKQEITLFENLKPAIGLFAVSIMHNSVIEIDEKTASALKVSAPQGGPIEVMAYGQTIIHSPPEYPEPKTLSFGSPIFVTGLASNEYCDPQLLAESQPWECDIEVNKDMKLAKLG
jgi:hypothetical protein